LIGEYELNIIQLGEQNYPELLANIANPPELLFCIGNLDLLKKKLVTIVGTREYTEYGLRICRDILSKEYNQKIVYVSGLAKGIDAQVHKAALSIGIGTIAVVAGGIDKGFPRENEYIFRDIVKSGRGLIISEFPPGRTPIKGMFPMRNRILAGLSKVTIVVEAGEKSGAMITANNAIDFGREVATFPNNIFQDTFKGNNKLLSNGATMITSIEDLQILFERNLGVPVRNQINQEQHEFEKLIPVYMSEFLKSKNQAEFTFEEISEYAFKYNQFESSIVSSDLTKVEMQGILSLNKFGNYGFLKT
jgi:DNA processing protein